MHGEVLLKAVKADQAVTIDAIDSPYAHDEQLKSLIYQRGI
jgi:N-acetylneuraminate synthase